MSDANHYSQCDPERVAPHKDVEVEVETAASRRVFQITEEEYEELRESYGGYCVACRDEAYGVEPDARGYACDSCGKPTVFGIEELLMRGLAEFVSDSA